MSSIAAGLIERHRTAMHRTALSRPMALALEDGLIPSESCVFDYGCGRGGDLHRLQNEGIVAAGWDPAFAPNEPRRPADVVNLGYVVNVIERPEERVAALKSAWKLARKVLVIAVRLEWEARTLRGRPHGDGLITAKGTFQRLFTQEELRSWIDSTLEVRSIAAAPGIFYVFRGDADAQRFLAARFRQRASAPKPLISEQLFEAHRSLLDALAEFVAMRGRLPRDEELSVAAELRSELGSIPRAFAVLRRVVGTHQWQTIAEERARDLLVYLALANFGGRPAFSQLPVDLQYDVRDFYGSYKEATRRADELLFAAGRLDAIDTSVRAATIGKLTPEALYVHTSALPKLPPLLRVYEGCGRAMTGTVGDANILKLHRQRPQVSYLAYPTFEKEAHPALTTVVIARLAKLDVTFRDFRGSSNPPILHRKETFVGPEYSGRARFERLTRREEEAGLFDDPASIGTRDGWTVVLDKRGLIVRGHQLRQAPKVAVESEPDAEQT
jgi:DNA phosphorothioation-associated putative methyltransferase